MSKKIDYAGSKQLLDCLGRTVKVKCRAYDRVLSWTLVGVDQGCLLLVDGPSKGQVECYIVPLQAIESCEVLADGREQ